MASFGAADKTTDKKVNIPNQPQPAAAYGYPAVSAGYATTQTASPYTQAYTQAGYPAGYPSAAQYAYPQGPPPPYSVAVSQPSGGVAGYYTYPQLGYPYPYGAPTQAGLMYPGTTYVVPGSYDPGARFDGIARQSIPPVPPGVAPNAAQLAMMQQNAAVMMSQQKSNGFLGEGGGFTFW